MKIHRDVCSIRCIKNEEKVEEEKNHCYFLVGW